MAMADVKICGLRTIEAIEAAHSGGARWVGFVFYSRSPRHLSLEDAKVLRDYLDALVAPPTLPPPTLVVLVVDADDGALDEIVEAVRPEVIQCHGDESPTRVKAIKARYDVKVMKAIRVSDEKSVRAATAYDDVADMLLFDSAPEDAELPGGTGQRFDWGLTRSYEGKLPWLLAGGLTPENVGDAIRLSGAEAVDVSSGVESTLGDKDCDSIRRFLSASL